MNSPDLNAPRFRPEVHCVINKEFFARFKVKYPQYSDYPDIALEKAIKYHNGLIWNQVIDSRDGVELQSRMGLLFIGTVPQRKKKYVAWKKSIELGVKVFHKNWDTDNRICKIFYSNYGCKIDRGHLWWFNGVRQFKRAVPKTAVKQWMKYVRVDDFRSIWDIFKKSQFRDKCRSRQKEELKVYNDFDI